MRSGTLGIRSGVIVLALLLGLSGPLLATTANDICPNPTVDPCVVSTTITVTDPSVLDFGTRQLRIAAGGALDVFSGSMTINARRLDVQALGFVRASGSPSAPAGDITVNADEVSIAGTLSANGAPGGNIGMTITNALNVSGTMTANFALRSEVGGNIQITAGSAAISGTVSTTGGFDAVGGDITINTVGGIIVTNTINASGGDGGSVDLEAGVNTGSGDLILTESSILRADATLSGGFGGTVDVTANGPEGSGNLTLNGLLSAVGLTGGTEVGGGSGGCITAAADGDLRVARAAARLSVEGGGPDGDGGEIEISSARGVAEMQGIAVASSAGAESNGGAVSIDGGVDVTVSGSVSVTGGDGGAGEISIGSTTASALVTQSATLDASSTSGGGGGSICVESGAGGDGPRLVVIEGRLVADGGATAGAGGSIELAAGDSARVSSTGSLHASGGLGGGNGGTVSVLVTPGSAFIEGPVVAMGGSGTGTGGIISIEAGAPNVAGRIAINADLDARGFGVGGEIGLAASGGIDIRSDVLASSSADKGGIIQIDSQGNVSVGARVSVDGTVEPGEFELFGRIEMVGCTVSVCAVDAPSCPGSGPGTLSSLGPRGVNRVTGRDLTVVLGTMRANLSSGRNELLYDGTPAREPLVAQGAQVTPAERLIVDPSVVPCPRCGNRIIDPPETCDDGNELDGDGCSASCQIEESLPGDANGDFVLSSDDLGFIITEIFDGDGDSVSMVSGGAFAGAPGADANGDERITVGDLSATARLLAP